MGNVGPREVLIIVLLFGGLLAAGPVMEAGSLGLDALAAWWRA